MAQAVLAERGRSVHGAATSRGLAQRLVRARRSEVVDGRERRSWFRRVGLFDGRIACDHRGIVARRLRDRSILGIRIGGRIERRVDGGQIGRLLRRTCGDERRQRDCGACVTSHGERRLPF
jgi:hypothetical protein